MSSVADLPPLDGTFGALFIGLIVATVLWGVHCLQTWYYYDNYKNDHILTRALVMAVWISDTCHQVVICHALYYYCIKHWGEVDKLELVTWTLYSDVFFNGVTGLLVQIFFTHRIWKFRRSIPVTGAIIILITGQLALSLAYVALGAKLPTFTLLKTIKPVSLSINAVTAVADVAISIAICSYLNAAKTGFAWSNSVINRLMLFAINTGIFTSLCACASLILYIAYPNLLLYFGCYLTIGRLYSNSLLATLNSRKGLRRQNDSSHESHSLTDRSRATRGIRGLVGDDKTTTTQQIQVQIETTHDYMTDGPEDDRKNAPTDEESNGQQSVPDVSKKISFVGSR